MEDLTIYSDQILMEYVVVGFFLSFTKKKKKAHSLA